ncbi:MAG: hypothetical protein KDH96_04700 [Candidatus Riesia sp.]|nr:hypothetical protein [Candidatus Riesia sp.]
MFDQDHFNKTMNFGKQYRSTVADDSKDFKYSWAAPARFDFGNFKMRFCPSIPSKCELGYRVLAIHKVETVPGQDPIEVLGYESAPEDNRSMALHRLLLEIAKALESNPEFKSFLDDNYNVAHALQMLIPWRRYLFPTIFWARRVDHPTEKKMNGKPKDLWLPNDEGPPVGIIFEITAKPDKPPALLSTIINISKKYENFNCSRKGRDMTFSRVPRYKYDLLPDPKPSQFPKEVKELLEDDYPKIDSFKKGLILSHSNIVDLLYNSWWAKDIKPFIDMSVIEDNSQDEFDSEGDDEDEDNAEDLFLDDPEF